MSICTQRLSQVQFILFINLNLICIHEIRKWCNVFVDSRPFYRFTQLVIYSSGLEVKRERVESIRLKSSDTYTCIDKLCLLKSLAFCIELFLVTNFAYYDKEDILIFKYEVTIFILKGCTKCVSSMWSDP